MLEIWHMARVSDIQGMLNASTVMKRIFILLTWAAATTFWTLNLHAQNAPGMASDAGFMSDWAHRDGRWFSYFLPTENWLVVETANGIDITSPTGEEGTSYAFAAGGLTLAQVEGFVFQAMGATNAAIVARQGARGPFGAETVEFTAQRNGMQVHGMLVAQANGSWFSTYMVMAPAQRWQQDAATLLMIRKHVTYMGRDTWNLTPNF